ncbi:methionine aminotransferase [Catalinimonas sp. 4WD22]|uniref:methionine aminotransferase n=1 Tax=Catalinimonas locisalis TaxID=3133978 RepID=UPI0031010579
MSYPIRQPEILSKLPNTGTTIFTIMSKMASEHGAINLSQGFPDFSVPDALQELVSKHMHDGHNQYAPMPGLPALREQIAAKILKLYQREISPESEVTVTAGATEALHASIAAVVHPGDEVIVLEPAYDSYIPSIQLNGGITVPVSLNPKDFSVNWDKVRDKVNDRTRLIIVNTPHNPTGSVFSSHDLEQLAETIRDTNILVLSDEVYEHIIFDGRQHQSMLCHEELAARSIAVFSFGKTFHATGWKVGYCIAPASFSTEIRKVHQYLQFSVHTPTQFALAEYMDTLDGYQYLADFYQEKRDLFLRLTQNSSLKALPAQGTYFQLFSYQDYSKLPDRELAEKLTQEKKLASIPISVFYHDQTDHHYLRFCFAKGNETLKRAAEILCSL